MKRALFLFLIIFSLSFAQFYQFYIVKASDHTTMNLIYDNNSTSYKDNSIENPDAQLRICALSSAELQNKWVSLAYADGMNPGDYIEITHFPIQITRVPPNNCVYLPLEISSFKAWYPSIPFLFISNTTDLSTAERIKFPPIWGWLKGNYTVVSAKTGNNVNITVTRAVDENNITIIPDVNFLVVGLMQEGILLTTDTAITSIGDPVVLSLGSYSGNYTIHVNGIGPGQFGPNVTIITPQPITYNTNMVPFTYSILSYYPLDSCWYVLDGKRVDMPDCTISYILRLQNGTHTLVLYANDTAGQNGSDSVKFKVGIVTPPYYPGGPGGPHVPQPTPEVPPVIPPAYDYFTISPEDIHITIDYPSSGESSFFLYSKYKMVDIQCTVKGDFAQYSTVDLVSNEVGEGGTIDGTVTVEIPPEILIDYKGSKEGLLQCIGRSTMNSSLFLSTSANVYLEINEPLITVENITVELYPGQTVNTTILLNNTGQGNASTYAFDAQFEGKESGLITITQLPGMIGHGQEGILPISIFVAPGFPTGEYTIPIVIYENGKLIGSGNIKIKVKEGLYLPLGVCAFPVLTSFYIFYDTVPMWVFLIILLIANYALLEWRKRHIWQRRLLMASLPTLLSLPGIWLFAPCFMMNLALAQFISTFLWKLLHEKEREELYSGRRQKRKPYRSEEKAEEGKDRKMAKEEEK